MSGWTRDKEWATLMRTAISGDAGAFHRFLVSETPHLRSMARNRCRTIGASERDAEDIVQEVLLAIHLKRGTWDQARPIGPGIAAIVRNKVVDTVRRRGRHPSVPIEDVLGTLGVEDHNDGLSDREIDRLLIQLKAEQRDIIQSISIKGSSVRETADRLHMSERAVRVALHRSLKTLAALYRSRI